MYDPVMQAFLARQAEELAALERDTELVVAAPLAGSPPYRYLVEFRCRGLVRRDGEVSESERFAIGINFPRDYLRSVRNPSAIVTWLAPSEVFSPHVRPPFICLGNIPPGTGLVSLLYQVHEIITYQRYSTTDALDREAADWATGQHHRLPVDRRPLRFLHAAAGGAA